MGTAILSQRNVRGGRERPKGKDFPQGNGVSERAGAAQVCLFAGRDLEAPAAPVTLTQCQHRDCWDENPSLQEQQGGGCYFPRGKDHSLPPKMGFSQGNRPRVPRAQGEGTKAQPREPQTCSGLAFPHHAGGWLVIPEVQGGGYWGFLFLSHWDSLGSAAFHGATSLLCIISILKRLCPRYLFISKMPRQLRKRIQTVFLLLCFRVSPIIFFFFFRGAAFCYCKQPQKL